jgi:hypothetical protein
LLRENCSGKVSSVDITIIPRYLGLTESQATSLSIESKIV